MPFPCVQVRLAPQVRSEHTTQNQYVICERVKEQKVAVHLFIDLSTSRRLVSVITGSLSRKGLVLVLSLLLILLSLGSSSELETDHNK